MSERSVDPLVLVAFFAGVVIAATVFLFFYVHLRRRHHKDSATVSSKACDQKNSKAAAAWPDPEKGELTDKVPTDELCDRLRSLLEEEIAKGLHTADVKERMARLELKLAEVGPIRSSHKVEAVPPVGLRAVAAPLEVDTDGRGSLPKDRVSSADTRTPSSSDRSGSSTSPSNNEDLPGSVQPPSGPSPLKEGALPPELAPAALNTSEDLKDDDPFSPEKEFGPTDRQLGLRDPPEKHFYGYDEEEAEQISLGTLQRNLGKRDAQTTELHKQLRVARQELWLRAAEARDAKARLQALLADPSRGSAAQAEAIQTLQSEVRDLSTQLADTQFKERQWSAIAKRQRAFFMQSERMSQETTSLLRRHPAGDIFLAPPPVLLEDEEIRDEPLWDVGTSHCNPYCVDSWPFEPNVLAARASAAPNLNRWDEGEDEDYEECCDDEEDEEQLLRAWGRREGGPQPPHHAEDEEMDGDEEGSSAPASPWNEVKPQRHGGLPPLHSG
eukprot:TRINITY_DN65285_c0_g1_i1.p1 TRINITY_DN65285_c0_g1~~TRINITY_DN65285_c0_g1_i1.p1  ORF type:complete len:498 (-),score=133.19 TRINITY_DN65285_c0_g1_i1:221-1714(-)